MTEKLINMLNLSGSKGALTPGGKDIGVDDRVLDCELEYYLWCRGVLREGANRVCVQHAERVGLVHL